jgi:glyoxylase-like metal-dependent hydrolase (beta-lactamase superfamily II)
MRAGHFRAAIGTFGALLFGCAPASVAQSPAPPTLISGGPYVLDRAPDGNSIVFEDANGLVVIDTGRHLAHQEKILGLARERGKPIRAIVNTHWHLDHSGGNAELRAVHPGAKLYASTAIQGALEGFLARSLERGKARLADPSLSAEEKAATRLGVSAIENRRNLLPDVPVTGPIEIALADRRLILRVAGRAATEGDVWIWDPASKTLIAGDLVVLPAPFFDTACPQGWRRAIEGLAQVEFERLIPGHGKILSRSEFDTYRTAFHRLIACSESAASEEACIGGWLQDAGPLLTAADEPATARGLLDYYIDEILRSPEKKAEFCGTGLNP